MMFNLIINHNPVQDFKELFWKVDTRNTIRNEK